MVLKNKTQRTQTRKRKQRQSKRKQRQSKGKQRHKQSKRLKIKQSGGLLPFSDFRHGTYTFFQNIGNQWYGKPLITSPNSHYQRLMQR